MKNPCVKMTMQPPGFLADEPADCFAGTIEKRVKGFGSGTVDVGADLGAASKSEMCGSRSASLVLLCERRLEKGELLDRPLFDGNIREPLAQRLGGLLRAQKGRDNDERRLAVEAVGEVSSPARGRVRSEDW